MKKLCLILQGSEKDSDLPITFVYSSLIRWYNSTLDKLLRLLVHML